MLSKEERLSSPNYLLTKYQNDIYRTLVSYMETHNLSKKEMAKKMDVSGSYISQVLHGDFNFTLKKIIQIALAVDKVPVLDFVEAIEFWDRMEKKSMTPPIMVSINSNEIKCFTFNRDEANYNIAITLEHTATAKPEIANSIDVGSIMSKTHLLN